MLQGKLTENIKKRYHNDDDEEEEDDEELYWDASRINVTNKEDGTDASHQWRESDIWSCLLSRFIYEFRAF